MLPAEESQITKLLSKYKNLSITRKDVSAVIAQYRSLTYNLQKFVFNDGSTRELFNLQGTIPVYYKNNTYHIPICIWLMDTHPQNAPMCYVKPTATMQIKVSMFVDHNGKIYLPYLHDWSSHTSDLLSLIQVMIVTFGEHPPVYAKPREQQQQQQQQPQMPPYPGAYMPGAGVGPGGPGPYMPYPPATAGSGAGGGGGGPPAGGGAFPPYPTGNNFAAYPPYPTAGGAGGGPAPATGGVYPPYYPPAAAGGYNAGYNPLNPGSTGTITEEHIKASLISAVEDKLRRRIQEKVNQYHAEIDTLNRTKQELVEGSTKIDAIVARLQREETEMQKNLKVLRDKEGELEKSLDSLENSEAIDPDEAVTTTAPLYKQLLNAYAEEAATEDAIYYLGEALRGGVIDLEAFLKHVRQLSRKQFMLRATMQKCRQKAGLAG